MRTLLLFLIFCYLCIGTDGLVFNSKKFELYRPVVLGEKVLIDCSTDENGVDLQLKKRDKISKSLITLKPDNSQIKLSNETYTIFVSSEDDGGEYICSAQKNGVQVEKSLIVFIAGKVSGDIPKPVISKPYNSVLEGTKLVLKCHTKGTFAKLSWFKEGAPISSSYVESIPPEFRDGTVVVESTLTFYDVKLADVGTYTCEAVSRFNKSNSAESVATVHVRGKKLYWINDSPATYNAVTAAIGSSVIISCAMSHPAKKVKFFRAISGRPAIEIHMNGDKYQLMNNQELVIRKVMVFDHGTYICKAENNAVKEKKITLFVTGDAVTQPEVHVSPKFVYLDYNAAANITCTTYGSNAHVEWLMNVKTGNQVKLIPVPSEKIFGSSRRTPQGNIEKKWTLIFKNVKVKDAGKYLCKVTVNRVPAFSEVDLAVKDPLSPQIKKFLSQITKEDQRTSLNCRSKGAPKPVIRFFKDGVEITNVTKGYKMVDRKLIIDHPRYPDHDGMYTCSVTNMFGRATGKANLSVTVVPRIDKSKDIVVVGGSQDLEVTCSVNRSNPIPKITWYFQPWSCPPSKGYDCSPISSKWKRADSKTYDILPKNTDITMNSRFKVPKKDTTKYFIKCVAAHKYGSDSHQIIGLIDKRDASNLLSIEPKKIETDEKQSFSLTCRGEAGLFISLSWQVNGTMILADNKTVIIEESGSVLQTQISKLTVLNVNPSLSGLYQCVAIPARSEDQPVSFTSNVKVNKIYPPRLLSLHSPSVIDGERAVITCNVDSHPPARITWYRNNEQLDNIGTLLSSDDCDKSEQGRYFVLSDTNVSKLAMKKHQLIICKSSWKRNNGTFTCSAKNDLGKMRKDSSLHIFASPVMLFQQTDSYLQPDHKYSRNCTSEGNPSPYTWWEKEINGVYVSVTINSTNGFSYLNISHAQGHHYGNYRCVAANRLGVVYEKMKLRQPLVTVSKYESDSNMGATASFIAAAVAGVLIVVLLAVLIVILFKRKKLYGGFYILSIPPSPDYFQKLDPTKSVSEQTHKLPFFPEWEFPRNKVKLKKQVGAGAFGEVYVADAIGIMSFDPRYKITMKHKALLSRKRLSLHYFNRTKSTSGYSSKISRADSVASSRSSRSTKSMISKDRSQAAVVAVKKLKEDATQLEYKDLISEMKILIHIGQQENIVNLLGACTKGVEKDTMVILEFCPNGNLLTFMKERRQMFKPIWSKQHVGMEKEFTTFDLCVTAYQVAKGLDFLASRKCVHRDVAARNVLVGENYVMKVADFGLARDVYHDERYVKMSGGLLPIKWMAIEAIQDRVFTHQTDVWSYGVLLWELMTLGGSPYPGVHVKDLLNYLTNGNRMSQPQLCPNELYSLMRECWSADPKDRPSFSDIVLRLARVIEAHCNPDDITLYVDKCHVSGGSVSFCDDDYLRPVDNEIGSFHFSSPPSYSPLSDGKNDSVFKRKPSERYVPDNRFIEENKAADGKEESDYYEKAIDSFDGSEHTTEPKAKLDEIVCEKDTTDDNDVINNNAETTPLYANTLPIHNKKKENSTVGVDEDKDIDENTNLLNNRTPSPVEELSNFIDEEYERMGNDSYMNA